MTRGPVIATGLAVAAVILAGAALAVVSGRGGGAAAPVDRLVDGASIRTLAMTFRARFDKAGAHLADPDLERKLGLGKGDTLVTLNGYELTSPSQLMEATFGRPASMYAEVARGSAAPVLERWRIDWAAVPDHSSLTYAPPPPPPSSDPYTGGGTSNPFGTPSGVDPYAPDPVLDAIEKLDDTHYRIPASVVDHVLANPLAFAKGARVVPAVKNGVPDGFKLYAIRPSSAYARLGLMNGDTLERINGLDLTSAESALEAYTKLRDATEIVVEITRRGQPLTLSYEIAK